MKKLLIPALISFLAICLNGCATSYANGQQGTLTPNLASPMVTITSMPFSVKSTGNTAILVTDANRRFVPTAISVEVTAISGASTQATLGFGVTGTGYTDIAAATTIPGSTVATIYSYTLVASPAVVTNSTTLYCRCSVATASTSETVVAHVTGYYEY